MGEDGAAAPAAAGVYPPPPPSKKSGNALENLFLTLAEVGGGVLTILLTLIGAILWGVGHFLLAGQNLTIGGQSLMGIGVILTFFGLILFLCLILDQARRSK